MLQCILKHFLSFFIRIDNFIWINETRFKIETNFSSLSITFGPLCYSWAAKTKSTVRILFYLFFFASESSFVLLTLFFSKCKISKSVKWQLWIECNSQWIMTRYRVFLGIFRLNISQHWINQMPNRKFLSTKWITYPSDQIAK